VKRALVGIGVLLLVTVGCSGGSSGPTMETWAAQANPACQKLAEDNAAGLAALGPSPTPDALTSYAQATFIPEAIATYRGIAALPAPKDQVDTIQALMIDVLAELKLVQADPVAGGSNVNQASLVARLHSLGLTSCGAGFKSTIDKASFVSSADSICSNLLSQMKRGVDDLSAKSGVTDAQRADFVNSTVLPLFRSVLDQIEAIGYPPDDATTIAKIVADSRALNERIAAEPSVFFLGTKDPQAKDLADRWIAYGVTTC
jgi:hypothetical protein